ncbi:MAG: hypothetical protein ACRES9_11590 [Gammaproteobacteria bacterium]
MKLFTPLSLTLLAFVGACTMAPQQPSPGSENPIQIWHTGVGYAAHGRYKQAESYLRSSAESGFYPAQMDLAVLLETSPKPVLNPEAAYA